ncbi:MAG: glycosyl hydrolase, partial [Dehalococcoidia bacterium]
WRSSPGKNYSAALTAVATFVESTDAEGAVTRKFLDAGQNPPADVVAAYFLRDAPPEGEEIELSFLSPDGGVIRAFSSAAPAEETSEDAHREPRPPKRAGMNRFVWDMRYPGARPVPGDKTTEEKLSGPLAPPGSYRVALTVGGQTQTRSFEILKDPRVAATDADFQAQFDLLIQIRDRLSETHDSINALRRVARQVDEWTERARGHASEKPVTDAAGALREKLSAIENELIQTEYRGARDRLNLPVRLNTRLAEVSSVVAAADFAPPTQAYDVFADIRGQIDPHIARLREIIDRDVADFERLVRELELPAIATGPLPE